MAQDSTRRLLKIFGIAVTDLEDALEKGAADEIANAEADLRAHMQEVTALVERLRGQAAQQRR